MNDGTAFNRFTHQLYDWINSETLPRSLATRLLRFLLIQLGDDALAYFASIWSSDDAPALRIAALRHATAFVQAHSGKSRSDVQLIVPALLIALQDGMRAVREAGVGVLRSMVAVSENGGSDIYGLETIYGSRSSKRLT